VVVLDVGSGAMVLWLVIVCLFICSLCFRACFTSERSEADRICQWVLGPLNNARPYIVVSGWFLGWFFGVVFEVLWVVGGWRAGRESYIFIFPIEGSID